MNMSEKLDRAFDVANHYAWGRQDALNTTDSAKAMEFGAAWRVLTEAFESQRTVSMPTMRDGYDTWTREGELTIRTGGGMWKIIPNRSGLFQDRARMVPVPLVLAY